MTRPRWTISESSDQMGNRRAHARRFLLNTDKKMRHECRTNVVLSRVVRATELGLQSLCLSFRRGREKTVSFRFFPASGCKSAKAFMFLPSRGRILLVSCDQLLHAHPGVGEHPDVPHGIGRNDGSPKSVRLFDEPARRFCRILPDIQRRQVSVLVVGRPLPILGPTAQHGLRIRSGRKEDPRSVERRGPRGQTVLSSALSLLRSKPGRRLRKPVTFANRNYGQHR